MNDKSISEQLAKATELLIKARGWNWITFYEEEFTNDRYILLPTLSKLDDDISEFLTQQGAKPCLITI